jgi:hypothetical protein
MRLSDHLMTEIGGSCDVGGIFTRTCAAIREAERFELTDDVARAAYNLTKSKPTTLLSALPLSRAPYRRMWLEWRGGLTSDMIRRENKRDPAFAPDPLKQGCLIETDATGQRGVMTFCWLHKENPTRIGMDMYSPANIAPLGTLFNWDETADVFEDGRQEYRRRYPTEKDVITAAGVLELILLKKYTRGMSDDEIKGWMERSVFRDWSRFAGLAGERKALRELGRHAMPFVPSHAHGFFEWCADSCMQSEVLLNTFLRDIVVKSWEQDILGEGPFVETVIAMMNSRNAIETRPVDLTSLNRARAKKRRPLFLSYRTTHLRLSQAQTRAFRAGLLSKEDAGRHRVRGHFKIRRTGVYWWSPFFRGDPAKPVKRQEYTVE